MSARRISVVHLFSAQGTAGVHAYPVVPETFEHLVQQPGALLMFRLGGSAAGRWRNSIRRLRIIADTVVPVSAALIRARLWVSFSTDTLMVFMTCSQ